MSELPPCPKCRSTLAYADRGLAPNWQLYYLYGLERACELNQVALLADRDW